jgi:FKBP-type peptidyl-prolyl cis-trans isomerase
MKKVWLPLCLLLPFSAQALVQAQELPAQPQVEARVTPEVDIEVLESGQGPALEVGAVASFAYTCSLEDGTVVATNQDAKPLRHLYRPDDARVIPGWRQGVAQMRQGEQRRVRVPASLAYGDTGAGEEVPPGTPLVFESRLLKVEPAPGVS